MVHPQRRKVMQPAVGILKFRNHLHGNHFFQYVPLPYDPRARLLDQLGLVPLSFLSRGRGLLGLFQRRRRQFGLHARSHGLVRLGKGGRTPEILDLHFELVGRGLDGHARAVERERHQNVLAEMPLVLRAEDGFGQRKRVPDVEQAVGVRIGKVHEERLFAAGGGERLEGKGGVPEGAGLKLGGEEGVAFRRAFGGHSGGGGLDHALREGAERSGGWRGAEVPLARHLAWNV
mmetsp:Transcript_5384/g.11110  ORF Transcript_5384/g.11110 Transcript_5384/m.11110 type:complete len:232 (-) Transcript_5384:44-739(-)